MTPEEKVDQEIWAVLKEIKKQSHFPQYHIDERPVAKCRLPDFAHATGISKHRIEDIFKLLEKKGALKIQKGSNGGRLSNTSKDAFYLIINSKKFHEVYNEFLKIITVAQKLKKLREEFKKPIDVTSANDLLSEISDEAKTKLWKTVNALRLAYELEGDAAFKLPWEKFERNRVSQEDTIANLRNLHRKGFIVVMRWILSRDPKKLPHWAKPQIKGAETILDNPDIYHNRDTTVTLKKPFFDLEKALKEEVHKISTKEKSTTTQPVATDHTSGEYVRFDENKHEAQLKLKGKDPISFTKFRADLIRCFHNSSGWLTYSDIRQCEGCEDAPTKKIRQSAMKINSRVKSEAGFYPAIDFKPKQHNANTPLSFKWNM